ncbi:MAG: translocation/assembly module TamB, partial [Acidobacteria bacterium]
HNTARIVGAVLGFDPVKVGGPDALAGSMNGALELSVEWRDDVAEMASGMEARGTWRLTPSTVAHEPVDRGVISGEWRDGLFNAQTIDLEGPGLHVTGRGRFAVTKGVSAATFEMIATDVHSLEPWTGRVIHGAATARGELRGAFDAPRIIASGESAEITDSELGRLTHVAATIDFTLPEWESLKTNGPLRVQASGWTSVGGAVAHEVVFDGRLDSWTAFRGRADGRFNEILAETSIAADWANELTVDVAAASLTRGADQWRLDPSAGRLRVTSARVIATNVRLTSGAQSIGVDGTLLIGAGDLTPADRLTASAVNLDLAPVDRFLGLGTGVSGRLTATASLAGRLSDPRGRIVLNARDLAVRGYAITSVNGGIDLGAGAATVDIAMRQPNGVAFKALGRVPLAAILPAGSLDRSVPSPDWDVNVVTDPVELKIFAPLVPKVDEIEGQMIADVRIVGAADRPRITGTVALADAAFRIPSAGIGFSKVTADIGFQPDLVTVRKFVARDKHGHPLTITGELAVSELQVGALNVNVEADRLAIVDNAIGSIELSALLQLSGDVWHPKLTGNIEVVNGRVEVDRLLRVLSGDPLALVAELNLPPEGETLVDIRGDAARAAGGAPSRTVFDSKSFLSGLDAEIRILAPDNLILRGSRIRPGGKDSWSLGDLNVTVGGELTTTRRPGGAPVVVGDVTTIRGTYSFEGKRFEIQRGGHIRFNGDVPMNPSFDVRGVRRIQGVEARVDVRGRLSDPTLQLGSNLPLDEADVLSMIIFNRPVSQLGETQRADLVGAAASLAGGFVTSPLASKLSQELDLDLLELETVTFGQNVAPRIRIGQQVGNRLFVQFAQQFGPQSLSELTAEYQLARFLRLQANTAQGPGSRAQRSLMQRTERFGLDLIFFFNY